MKFIIILLLIFTISYSKENIINGFKDFKFNMTLEDIKSIPYVKNVDFLNPLCFINTKHSLTMAGINIGSYFVASFSNGMLKHLEIHSIPMPKLNILKSAIEKRYGKKFIFTKSKNDKTCDYYAIKIKNAEIGISTYCPKVKTNNISVYFIDHSKTIKYDKVDKDKLLDRSKDF